MSPTDRRSFCLASAAGLALAALPRRDAGPALRLSLAQWSRHRALFAGELDPLDFPREARERFGLDAVEYVSSFYRERAADFGLWRELRSRTADAGVTNLLIMVDGEGALGATDAVLRRRACERHFRWIAAAGYLDCRAIRVNAEGEGTAEEHSARVAESLVHLADVGADYGVSVLVENHGGRSSNGAWLARTIRAADHPGVGTLPDFGNFRIDEGEEYDRYRGLDELMPFAEAVSAKSYDFDERGEETTIEFARALGIVRRHGYDGHVGIEYEGERLPEPEGIMATKRLLERVLAGSAATSER